MKTDEGVPAIQRARARAMRGALTDAERRLWRLLCDRRLSGLKVSSPGSGRPLHRRLCVSARLIVEADGSRHGQSIRDEDRDAYLARQGWTALRFWNHEVLQNLESVLDTILARAGLPW